MYWCGHEVYGHGPAKCIWIRGPGPCPIPGEVGEGCEGGEGGGSHEDGQSGEGGEGDKGGESGGHADFLFDY
eukprot:3224910-Karenia_brevis.AAC.1